MTHDGSCKNCGARFHVSPSRRRGGRGLFCSMSCRREYQTANISYHALHKWLSKNYGPARTCENKKCDGRSSHFDWALIEGKEHACKRENYIRLCRSCHVVYDGLIEALSRQRMVAVMAIGTDGKEHRFDSCKEAAEILGVNPSGICATLKGRRHSAGGYKWVYARR